MENACSSSFHNPKALYTCASRTEEEMFTVEHRRLYDFSRRANDSVRLVIQLSEPRAISCQQAHHPSAPSYSVGLVRRRGEYEKTYSEKCIFDISKLLYENIWVKFETILIERFAQATNAGLWVSHLQWKLHISIWFLSRHLLHTSSMPTAYSSVITFVVFSIRATYHFSGI